MKPMERQHGLVGTFGGAQEFECSWLAMACSLLTSIHFYILDAFMIIIIILIDYLCPCCKLRASDSVAL